MAEIQTSTYKIRYATQQDVPVILQLIQELASYEKALHEVLATEESLLSSLSFPVDPTDLAKGFTEGYAKTLLISPVPSSNVKEEIAGLALYFHNYSTWQSRPGIFLEDLFVRPPYRGTGFGTALIQALARECQRLNCKRLEWNVLKWNTPSIDFYQGPSIGAQRMEEWVGMRVEGEALQKLARKR
ncbi:acetyltransferase [Cladophialophora yegresii CBS 114405]|uniref:Acetyltransferase n=1 Tax=Cladophialophora yegresii CBS 114405 TaxID=1182544 RepID=W9W1W2_9EURO|nr:acetyltransferase [Cladophialophora yegresii CBS 114405]EXJ58496.1 acetyltransferase [Cladophialophora yegresii CBS 114405]